jgi:predicted CopG family antitoxin
MVNITLSIPDDMYEHMKRHPELRWSEVARKSFSEKLQDLQLLADLKECEEAEKEFRAGKCIPFDKVIKKLGLENEI